MAKVYFPRINPFDRYTDRQFRKRFRLSKESVRTLAEEFENSDFSGAGTRRSGGLSHEEKVCLALRFLSSGALYSTVGDTQGVHASTVCRSVDAFVRFLFSIKSRYIKWPKRHQFPDIARTWYGKYAFPRIIGAVDGTHIPLKCPSRDDNTYFCRKGFHSINMLGLCGPDMKFTFVSAKKPGSAHDSFVFDESQIGIRAQEGGLGNYLLLGDSGYPLRPYMMTPFANPDRPEENAYNRAHISARNTIERAFGILKQRFRVLDHSAGYVMSSPEKTSLIALACVCLHNIAIGEGMELDVDEELLHQQIVLNRELRNNYNAGIRAAAFFEGRRVRDVICHEFFSVM